MQRFIFSTVLAAILLAAPPISPTQGDTVQFPVLLQDGTYARFEISLQRAGGNFTSEVGNGLTTYTNELYRVQIFDHSDLSRYLRFRMETHSGETFWLRSLALWTEVPANTIDGVWAPSHLGTTSILAATPDEYFSTVADANYGIPYIGAATASGRNVLALGMLRQDSSAWMESGPGNESYYAFGVTQTASRTASVVDEAFFFSRDPAGNWFETARQYTSWVDSNNGYVPFPVSEACYRPLYDTWYWSQDEVDHQLYADVSSIASAIGMESFLADSGWDAKAGEYARGLAGATGDYQPPVHKFPNIAGTFDFIRSVHNLSVVLWLQPFAVGRESIRYPATQNMHIETLADYSGEGWGGHIDWPLSMPGSEGMLENMNLCPRLGATQAYFRSLFQEMADKYHPEGYWLDAMDLLPTTCLASHEHDYETFGSGFRDSLESIRSTILQNNPTAVVQMRGPYANLMTKPFANVWQTPDSPGKPDQMHLLALKLRPFSAGVVFASDQLYWPNYLNEVETAKAAMTSVMTGVPSFGLDLITAPPSTIRTLKTWLGFYETYKRDLTTGRFGVFGRFRTPNHLIEGQARTLAFVRYPTTAPVPAGKKYEVILLNATEWDRLELQLQADPNREYVITTLDRSLKPLRRTSTASGADGILVVNAAVDQGAALVVNPRWNLSSRQGLQGSFSSIP